MEVRCGGLFFTSKFDSGNLARVEKTSKDQDDDEGAVPAYLTPGDVKADYEFNVWTKPDCAGTCYENGNRSWFYFGVRGGTPGRLIKITIMNLNRQGKLYSQGHAPMVRTCPGKNKWDRVRDRPSYETVDGQFLLTFTHRFAEPKGATTYFAFCYPYSYAEYQEMFENFDKQFENCINFTSKTPHDNIYYHRELLCKSLDNNRIDLITISGCNGMIDKEEERFDNKLFPDKDAPRCKDFRGKRVYLVSSRVHPGETPASYVFNGFIDFILREDDPRAKQLRKLYVFKLIPILNPDGVMRGHYRTDARGVNLNRMYLDPNFNIYPSIYASKSLLVFHHVHNRVKKDSQHSSEVKGAYSSPSPGLANVTKGYGVQNRNRTESPYSHPQRPSNIQSKLFTVAHANHPTRKSETNAIPPVSAQNKTYNFVYDKNGGGEESKQKQTTEETITVENIEESKTNTPVQSANNMDNTNEDKLESLKADLAKLDLSDANTVQEAVYDTLYASHDVASGGEFGDLDDEGIGNEGSDDDDMDFDDSANLGSGPYAPHLNDPKLKQIPASESGIAFYVDLHGHASKRGCFIYGNYFEQEEMQVENMLFPKLIAMNTAHFDFTGCNFTEKNMYAKDKKDGLSKEGAGRVAIYKALGLIHSYTLECNYNTGRMVNSVPPAHGDSGRATPPPMAGFPPKYTGAHFEEVGKAMAIAGLDMIDANPWSRLTLSEHASIYGLREWVRRYIRGLRGLPRGMPNRPDRAAKKASNASNTPAGSRDPNPDIPSAPSRGPGFVPRVALLAQQKQQQRELQQSESQSGGTPIRNTGASRRPAPVGTVKRELGPVRDGGTRAQRADRTKRQLSVNCPPANTTPSVNTATSSSSGLHHSMSAPVSLTMTTAANPDMKQFLPRQTSTGVMGPRQFMNTVVTNSRSNQQPPLPTPTPPPPSHRAKPAFTVGPSRGPERQNSANSQTAEGVGKFDRRASTDESSLSIEEEKINQLKNFAIPFHRPNNRTVSLDPPKSDPVKRKSKRIPSLKRRSNSYSPKSGKGARKNSTTDSDVERRRYRRRRGPRDKSSTEEEQANDVTGQDSTDNGQPLISPRQASEAVRDGSLLATVPPTGKNYKRRKYKSDKGKLKSTKEVTEEIKALVKLKDPKPEPPTNEIKALTKISESESVPDPETLSLNRETASLNLDTGTDEPEQESSPIKEAQRPVSRSTPAYWIDF